MTSWRRGLRPSPFLAMLLLAFPFLALVQASDSPRQKLVLALVSYHAGDRWTESILEGLRQSLPGSMAHLAVEHLDARRHDPDRLGSALAEFLREKYRLAPPDVIIAADDAALRYLRDRRDALFPGAPLVWCGINAVDHEDMRRLANATGVVEAVDVPAALRLIQRLQPDLRHIAVVAGASGLGAINLALFRQSRDGLPAEVNVEEWLDASESRLPELLASLPPRSAILRLANLKTDQGGDLSTGESMRLLSSQTRAPVYTLWDFDMGQGALAGVVVNGLEQGRLAGELTRRILEGASPESLPPRLNSPNLTMADHAQATRLRIRLSALPEDATVINTPPSLPGRYVALLWGLALALALAVAGLSLLARALRARRKAERALRAMRADFRAVIDNIQDVYYRADKAGNLTLVSPSGARLLGYDSVEDMLGKPNSSFWHMPEERNAFLERMRREGRVVDHEVTLRTRQGEPVVVATSSAFYANEAGEIQGVEGIFRDIRDRKRGEEAIVEAERRYRDLFANVPVAIFQASPDGRFLQVNPEYARIIGYASPQAMQDGVRDIAAQLYVDPADRDRYKRLLARDGEVYGFETRLRRLDGEIFWATMNSRVKRDASGKTLYYEGFLMDITKTKEAEAASQRMHEHLENQVAQRTRELQASNERLQELDTLKSQFLASASHELRTPLTSIMGFAKITSRLFEKHFQPELSRRPDLAPRGETILENLRILTLEGERLTRLVNDLLDLNTIESGALLWRDEDCDVGDLLRDAARAVQGQIAQRKDLAFRLDIPADLPRLRLDGDKLKQVVINILSNAVKFCDSGEIRLVARREDPHWLEIRLEDEGPGIPAKDLERIFEKFYQSLPGGPADHKPKGTGLGLTICRQIVEHYGGSITAQSSPGQGATFLVRLPIATDSPAAPAS